MPTQGPPRACKNRTGRPRTQKPHDLPPLPALPKEYLDEKGRLPLYEHPMDTVTDDLYASDYENADRLRGILLGMSLPQLRPLIKGLKRPPKGEGGKDSLNKNLACHRHLFPTCFHYEQLYPAWYLRKRLWAQTLRYGLGSTMSFGARQRHVELAKNYEDDTKWLRKWLTWAPPRPNKRIIEDWDDLTPIDGSEMCQVYRPPAPGYEDWENAELDLQHAPHESELRRYVGMERAYVSTSQ